MSNLSDFEKNIGYVFTNKTLLQTALTHSSYINEHAMNRDQCNERIEFLGDAVLELVSSDFLFEHYPGLSEGELTRLRASLVCEPTLAFDARFIHLSDYLILGKGEEKGGGRYRDSIVSDALEAVIGAIYLDGGPEAAKDFICRFVLDDIENKKIYQDAKTALQEIAQEKLSGTPEYRITADKGPDHAKTFSAEALVSGQVLGRGEGRTKKNAEQMAAHDALKTIKGTDGYVSEKH